MDGAAAGYPRLMVFRTRRGVVTVGALVAFTVVMVVLTALPVGQRLLVAGMVTLAPAVALWVRTGSDPWAARVTPQGLDVHLGGRPDPVHLPWPAVESARVSWGRLRLVVNPERAGPPFTNPWDRLTMGKPLPDGRIGASVRLGVIRPGSSVLRAEIGKYLPETGIGA